MIEVTQCDGDSIRYIGRARRLHQAKGAAHHLLDLLLAGAAIPGESALHLSSGVVMQRNVVHSGGEADNATGMPHENCGTGMLVMRVELLERHDIGSVILEKLGELFKEPAQTGRKGIPGCTALNCARFDQPNRTSLLIEHAVPGHYQTRVNAQRSHSAIPFVNIRIV